MDRFFLLTNQRAGAHLLLILEELFLEVVDAEVRELLLFDLAPVLRDLLVKTRLICVKCFYCGCRRGVVNRDTTVDTSTGYRLYRLLYCSSVLLRLYGRLEVNRTGQTLKVTNINNYRIKHNENDIKMQ